MRDIFFLWLLAIRAWRKKKSGYADATLKIENHIFTKEWWNSVGKRTAHDHGSGLASGRWRFRLSA